LAPFRPLGRKREAQNSLEMHEQHLDLRPPTASQRDCRRCSNPSARVVKAGPVVCRGWNRGDQDREDPQRAERVAAFRNAAIRYFTGEGLDRGGTRRDWRCTKLSTCHAKTIDGALRRNSAGVHVVDHDYRR
jgi:hypothetical protein